MNDKAQTVYLVVKNENNGVKKLLQTLSIVRAVLITTLVVTYCSDAITKATKTDGKKLWPFKLNKQNTQE